MRSPDVGGRRRPAGRGSAAVPSLSWKRRAWGSPSQAKGTHSRRGTWGSPLGGFARRREAARCARSGAQAGIAGAIDRTGRLRRQVTTATPAELVSRAASALKACEHDVRRSSGSLQAGGCGLVAAGASPRESGGLEPLCRRLRLRDHVEPDRCRLCGLDRCIASDKRLAPVSPDHQPRVACHLDGVGARPGTSVTSPRAYRSGFEGPHRRWHWCSGTGWGPASVPRLRRDGRADHLAEDRTLGPSCSPPDTHSMACKVSEAAAILTTRAVPPLGASWLK